MNRSVLAPLLLAVLIASACDSHPIGEETDPEEVLGRWADTVQVADLDTATVLLDIQLRLQALPNAELSGQDTLREVVRQQTGLAEEEFFTRSLLNVEGQYNSGRLDLTLEADGAQHHFDGHYADDPPRLTGTLTVDGSNSRFYENGTFEVSFHKLEPGR